MSRTTLQEVKDFNTEYDQFLEWKNGIEETIKVTPYNFDIHAPNPPSWANKVIAMNNARKRKGAIRAALKDKHSSEPNLKPLTGNMEQDNFNWQRYCEEREVKRPVGRPRLSAEEKVNRPPKAKRSDQMRALLEENGFTVEDGKVYDNLGGRWIFLKNGKVELKDGNRISTHAFLNQEDYNSLIKTSP